jgi:disulfide bond formation protein DsbB
MTQRQFILLAALGSAAMLLGALAFQHLGGLAPCKLCIWQRWPHGIAVAAGALGLLALAPLMATTGALVSLAGAGIAFYHTGVERGWWPGPDTCTAGGDIGQLDPNALFDQIMAAPLVRCDEVAWEFLGLSMASWNGLVSLGLAALWLMALRAPRQASSSASQ